MVLTVFSGAFVLGYSSFEFYLSYLVFMSFIIVYLLYPDQSISTKVFHLFSFILQFLLCSALLLLDALIFCCLNN